MSDNDDIDKVIHDLEQQGVNLNNYGEMEGLGDLVESALKKVGITEDRFKSWFNLKECNCTKRKQWLNKIFPFRK